LPVYSGPQNTPAAVAAKQRQLGAGFREFVDWRANLPALAGILIDKGKTRFP
jgi:hypothetical protein